MTGLIQINGKTYIFRDDHGYGADIWAWDIHGCYDKGMVHKWSKMPNKKNIDYVELFDIDNPPATVSYQPLLN